jgi:hypothetical protein
MILSRGRSFVNLINTLMKSVHIEKYRISLYCLKKGFETTDSLEKMALLKPSVKPLTIFPSLEKGNIIEYFERFQQNLHFFFFRKVNIEIFRFSPSLTRVRWIDPAVLDIVEHNHLFRSFVPVAIPHILIVMPLDLTGIKNDIIC